MKCRFEVLGESDGADEKGAASSTLTPEWCGEAGGGIEEVK